MGMRRLGLILAVVMLIASIGSGVFGCRSPQSKPLPDRSQEEKEPPPRELQQLQTSLERLYEELKPKPAALADEKQAKAGGEETRRSEGEETGEGGQRMERPETAGGIDWSRLHRQVERIHMQWSGLEHKVIQSGARPEDVAGIERELNDLPARVSVEDRSGLRLAANNAAGYLPDFLELYAVRVPADLLRLRYLARDVVNRVDGGDWAGADQDMVKMRELWSRALLQLKDTPRTLTESVHFDIGDLEEAVNKRDRDLVLIKDEIFEKNLDSLVRRLEAEI